MVQLQGSEQVFEFQFIPRFQCLLDRRKKNVRRELVDPESGLANGKGCRFRADEDVVEVRGLVWIEVKIARC